MAEKAGPRNKGRFYLRRGFNCLRFNGQRGRGKLDRLGIRGAASASRDFSNHFWIREREGKNCFCARKIGGKKQVGI